MKTRIITITITTPDDYAIEEPKWTLEDILDINKPEIKMTDFDINK